jgi:transposase-like protein
MRRSLKVAEVLPVLYLRGLSTGDFREALPALLGEEATAGLSPTTIARLTAEWQQEYEAFRKRDIRSKRFAYLWADGIHFRIRLENDRLCTLVLIGVREDGSKELIAVEDGYRESKESWLSVLRGLAEQGVEAPLLATGDGAAGLLGSAAGSVAGVEGAALLGPQDRERARQVAQAFAAEGQEPAP